MDLRRLRVGEWVSAAAGLVLLLSLFLPWYEVDLTGPVRSVLTYDIPAGVERVRPGDNASAWESLAAVDILLAFVAASGVLLAVVTATQRVPAVSIALAGLVTVAGLVGVVLVLIRVLDLPDGAGGREWGLWLGLAGAAGIVAGGVLSMRDERLSKPGRPTDATGRPAPAPTEIERVPAPRA
jgi:hypothetical protein